MILNNYSFNGAFADLAEYVTGSGTGYFAAAYLLQHLSQFIRTLYQRGLLTQAQAEDPRILRAYIAGLTGDAVKAGNITMPIPAPEQFVITHERVGSASRVDAGSGDINYNITSGNDSLDQLLAEKMVFAENVIRDNQVVSLFSKVYDLYRTKIDPLPISIERKYRLFEALFFTKFSSGAYGTWESCTGQVVVAFLALSRMLMTHQPADMETKLTLNAAIERINGNKHGVIGNYTPEQIDAALVTAATEEVNLDDLYAPCEYKDMPVYFRAVTDNESHAPPAGVFAVVRNNPVGKKSLYVYFSSLQVAQEFKLYFAQRLEDVLDSLVQHEYDETVGGVHHTLVHTAHDAEFKDFFNTIKAYGVGYLLRLFTEDTYSTWARGRYSREHDLVTEWYELLGEKIIRLEAVDIPCSKLPKPPLKNQLNGLSPDDAEMIGVLNEANILFRGEFSLEYADYVIQQFRIGLLSPNKIVFSLAMKIVADNLDRLVVLIDEDIVEDAASVISLLILYLAKSDVDTLLDMIKHHARFGEWVCMFGPSIHNAVHHPIHLITGAPIAWCDKSGIHLNPLLLEESIMNAYHIPAKIKDLFIEAVTLHEDYHKHNPEALDEDAFDHDVKVFAERPELWNAVRQVITLVPVLASDSTQRWVTRMKAALFLTEMKDKVKSIVNKLWDMVIIAGVFYLVSKFFLSSLEGTEHPVWYTFFLEWLIISNIWVVRYTRTIHYLPLLLTNFGNLFFFGMGNLFLRIISMMP